jgi:NAD-dependent deacetylase
MTMKNRFEVVKVLMFAQKNLPKDKKVGFILRDITDDTTFGCTFEEAFEMIKNEGSPNAEIKVYTVKQHGYDGRGIQPAPHLPLSSFDDTSWHLPMLNEEFSPHVPYTDLLLQIIKTTIKNDIRWNYEVKKRQWKRVNQAIYSELFSDEMKQKYRQLAHLIKEANQIVFITGAGLGTESGVPDFRGHQSIYSNQAIMHKMTAEYRDQHPEAFFHFIKGLLYTMMEDILPFQHISALKSALENLRPNEGHKFMARLENQKKKMTIITQNVDGLHEKAGNKTVIPIHGDISVFHCNVCEDSISIQQALELDVPWCQQEGCHGVYHPNIVLFGDEVQQLDRAMNEVKNADLLIVAGTSLQVSPANFLVGSAVQAKKVIVNHEPTDWDAAFDLVIHGPASTVFGEVEQFLDNKARPLCDVCHRNVAEGLFASRIGPTSAYYCQRCMDAPAEPYRFLVFEVAWRMHRIKDYSISEKLKTFLEATLSITGKTPYEFNEDVDREVKKLENRNNKKGEE